MSFQRDSKRQQDLYQKQQKQRQLFHLDKHQSHRQNKTHISNHKNSTKWNVPLWLFIWSAYLIIVGTFQIRSLQNSPSTAFSSSLNIPTTIRDKNLGDFSHRLNDFSIEIFSAPKPFLDIDFENNNRAIRSWLRLKPTPRITLLGYETGYDEAAKQFGLNLEKRVDKNFLGVPLFNSMLNRANQSKATVTVIINGDILLFDDFITTLKRVITTFDNFLIVGARNDIDNLPEGLDENSPEYTSTIREHVWRTGTLHTYGGMDVWAWNTNGPRLFDPIMPHFVFGRGKYDNWLTHETISAGRRQVVDVSEVCLTVHVRHDYRFVADETDATKESVNAFWSKGKKSKFELFINIYLSLHVGTYSNQKGNVLFAPWKLARCMENDGMCLLKRERPGICNCEFSSFVRDTQTDPVISKIDGRTIQCGKISVETKENFSIPILPPKKSKEPPPFGLPLTMTSVIEKVVVNNTVLLTALNFGYRGIMMNWICNMRQLNITNFVIAALDEPLYTYAYTRSLPVYLENTIFQGLNPSLLKHATYGSDAFKQLTKMKSRVVVRILQEGYNVIWTDCDIVYFKNPIQDLWSYNADIVIQSNAPDDEALNGRRRINSGFYLARSNKPTIQAFKNIIVFAARSRMSEQPCFYDVMCGKKGQTTVGNDGCAYKGMTVRLLNRFQYPNGITAGIWNTTDGQIAQEWPDLYILHNNWIVGTGKRPRFKRHGFTFFDNETELCTYNLPIESPTTIKTQNM